MDNNKKLLEGLLKADGIDPANITESERMVFRQMLEREKKRMKRLSWLTVGVVWIFAMAMIGLCVSEKIMEALHIPFVVTWLGLMAMMCFIFITRFPRHNRKLKESSRKVGRLHFLVHGKHRGFALVGKKDGKRFIDWPGILMIASALWLTMSLGGAGVYYLLCQRWIYSSVPMLHIFLCTVTSLSFVIFLLLEGLKAPLGELVEIKVISKQSKPCSPRPNIWRIIMKSKITKFAAAAVIIIAVLIGINQFGGSIDIVTPAFGITDVKELLQAAKTIHMKGRMYFPLLKLGKEQSSVEVEYWLDIENGKWKLTYPGYSNINNEDIKIHVSENISDGKYEMRVNHSDKAVSFSNLSPFQRRLFARKNRYTFFEFIYINFDLFDYIKVGQEVIDGADFDIWEGLREDNFGTQMKVKAWLSPTTGNFGRIKTWARQADGAMAKRMEIDLVERDIEIPDEMFLTEAPAGYVLKNTKNTAIVRELGNASVSNESVSLNCHIVFTMADGSVIIGWSSEDRESSEPQAKFFEDLQIAGPLPKLATEVYAIKASSMDEDITYRGYHLAYTQKKGKFYEWSIYIPEQRSAPKSMLGYKLVHRYNPESREINAKLSIAVAAELSIENADDFNSFVCGAMADLSDNEYVPEYVTYDNVLNLVEEIRITMKE